MDKKRWFALLISALTLVIVQELCAAVGMQAETSFAVGALMSSAILLAMDLFGVTLFAKAGRAFAMFFAPAGLWAVASSDQYGVPPIFALIAGIALLFGFFRLLFFIFFGR